MVHSYKLKEWISWPLLRAHACTTAVALGFHATWRCPREGFLHGGLQYGIAVTVALVGVTLPLALLQLTVGQLSQQDAVGVWRAVPFFRGVGYLRLLISFLGCVYSIIYLAMTTTYFIYTISNSLPFWECIELVLDNDDYVNAMNASTCLQDTFMGPIADKPEYYLAVSMIIVVLWIVFPFIFYNSVKLMKRIFYVLGPVVIILNIVIVACIGNHENLATFAKLSDWTSFLEPDIWHGAIVQALLSTQIAGGFLISAGDTVYASTNVQWTAIAFVAANVLSTWASLIFWFAISGPEKDTSVFAVLVQAYKLGDDSNTGLVVHTGWPLTTFLMLLLSGLITMLSLLYPVYDRLRRIGGIKWRLFSFLGSLIGAFVSLTALWGRLPALNLLADYAVPYLISFATLLEILAFVFIYGWKVLVEDVEFLTGQELTKFWVMGWCASPGIIVPFTLWWMTMIFIRDEAWLEPPWPAVTIISSALFGFLVLIVFAGVAIAKQVQYDFIGKLKSSFKSSRHWGPLDPITHYYWLARRDEFDSGNEMRNRYHRRQLGQLSGRPSFLTLNNSEQVNDEDSTSTEKKRSNSDDWTVYRKQITTSFQIHIGSRKRAKSLDWTDNKRATKELKIPDTSSFILDSLSIQSRECNNNIPTTIINT